MKITIRVEKTIQTFLFKAGHGYEVWSDGYLLCHGWAAGDEKRARAEATEHAERALRARAKAAAAAITGERE